MNNGYDETAKYGKCSIDRIDVNGNYEPNNCKFVSFKEQLNNTRKNVFLEYNGEKHTIAQWAEKLKIHPRSLWGRLHSGGLLKKRLQRLLLKGRKKQMDKESIKKALKDHSIEKLKYQDGIKIKEIAFADILTLINELESENERLLGVAKEKIHDIGEMGYSNAIEIKQLKDRIAELDDEIENGTLRKAPCKVGDTIYFDTYSRGDSIGVQPHKVARVEFVVRIEATPGDVGANIPEYEFGKSVFFTAEEAAANANG